VDEKDKATRRSPNASWSSDLMVNNECFEILEIEQDATTQTDMGQLPFPNQFPDRPGGQGQVFSCLLDRVEALGALARR